MVIQGWGQEGNNTEKSNNSSKERNPEMSGKESEIFYSIKEVNPMDENPSEKNE